MCCLSQCCPSYGDFSQSDTLNRGPDDSEATHLRGEDVNLVGALPHIAKQALGSVGRSNVAIHRLREVIKGEGLALFLAQTPDRLRVELAIFEGRQIHQGSFFGELGPDGCQFGLDRLTHLPGNGIQDIALFVQDTALPESRRKQPVDGSARSLS